MSWLFSQALVEEYSQGCGSDGQQSAPSSATNTPQVYSYGGKTKDISNDSLSGMTCKPLTEQCGEAVLTSFLEGFPVKDSRSQEKVEGLGIPDLDYGSKWQESSAKFDLHSSGWKTHQTLFAEDLPWSSVTCPRWGMMQDGVLLVREKPELITKESVSGSLPTLLARDGYDKSVTLPPSRLKSPNKDHLQERLIRRFLEKHEMLPTLTVHGNYNAKGASANSGDGLATAVRNKAAELGQELGPLNPDWCEWFMGFPVGWTSQEPMEKASMYEWWARWDMEAPWSDDPSERDDSTLTKMKKGVPKAKFRIKCLGNAQVPHCMELAWLFLLKEEDS